MATIIDRLVVKAEFTGIGAVLKEFGTFYNALRSIDIGVGRSAYLVGSYMLRASGAAQALVAGTIIQGFYSLASAIAAASARAQTMRLQLAALFGNRNRGNMMYEWIQDFAARTTFSVKEVHEAIITLANYDIPITTRRMMALGSVAKLTGRSFRDVAIAVARGAIGRGRFVALQTLGVTREGAEQVARAMYHASFSTLDFNRRIEVLTTILERRGRGALDKFSHSLEVARTNLADAWERLMAEMGRGSEGPQADFFNFITKGIKGVIVWVAQLRFELQLVGLTFAKIMATMAGSGFWGDPKKLQYWKDQETAMQKRADESGKHLEMLRNPPKEPLNPLTKGGGMGGTSGGGGGVSELARQLIGPRGVVAQIGANATEIAGLSRTRQQRTVTVRVETDQGSPWGRAMEELFNRFLYQAARQGAI